MLCSSLLCLSHKPPFLSLDLFSRVVISLGKPLIEIVVAAAISMDPLTAHDWDSLAHARSSSCKVRSRDPGCCCCCCCWDRGCCCWWWVWCCRARSSFDTPSFAHDIAGRFKNFCFLIPEVKNDATTFNEPVLNILLSNFCTDKVAEAHLEKNGPNYCANALPTK